MSQHPLPTPPRDAGPRVEAAEPLHWRDHAGRAKAIVAGGIFNWPHEHPADDGSNLRNVGFRVSEQTAGLSEALFAAEEIRRRVLAHDDLLMQRDAAVEALRAMVALWNGVDHADLMPDAVSALAQARAALSTTGARSDG